MKILTLLCISFVVVLYSCKRVDNSNYNVTCTDSCTTIQGRFITGNNEGVANISYEIKSVIKPTLGLGQTTLRKIASGKTDNNGFYSSSFSLNPKEYGEYPDATLYISFDYDKTKFVPVDWYENYGVKENLGPISRKDTSITADIYFTSKSSLKVRLENFVPVQAGDNFSVITSCGAGLERQYTSGGVLEATQTNTEGLIDACGDEQTTIIIRKKKNGVSSSSSTTIATPTGQTVDITFSY